MTAKYCSKKSKLDLLSPQTYLIFGSSILQIANVISLFCLTASNGSDSCSLTLADSTAQPHVAKSCGNTFSLTAMYQVVLNP